MYDCHCIKLTKFHVFLNILDWTYFLIKVFNGINLFLKMFRNKEFINYFNKFIIFIIVNKFLIFVGNKLHFCQNYSILFYNIYFFGVCYKHFIIT